METLNQMMARNVALLADRTFLIWGEDRISYAAFDRQTARMANVLSASGIGAGDRVGLYLPSTPAMALAFWACQRIGAVPAPISAMFRQSELSAILKTSRIRALVTDSATQAYFDKIRGDMPAPVPCFVTGGGAGDADTDLDAAMEAAPDRIADHPQGAHDTAALFFTSGTTGTPKAIEQTHFNQCSSLRDMMVSHRALYGQETYLCAVPLFTNFGLTVTLNLCVYTGGTLALHERWDTERVLSDISRHKASYFGGTPTMYVYLVGGYDAARHDLTSLRVCTTGGAPVPQPIIRRFEALSGVKVCQVYGSTETLGQNVMEPTLGPRKPGSAGLPVGSSRILIVGEDGQPMPVGEVGEVVIGGDCVTPGYADDPEATARSFGPDGWRSGDLGYVDADGFLFIVDRKKDVIITGGHNIYPLEVESALYQHGSVSICAVVPEPDAIKGEIPVAVVVPLEGNPVSAEDLMAFCREHLAAYKVPRRIEMIDDMPIEAAKIRKRDLVEALKSGSLDKYRKG